MKKLTFSIFAAALAFGANAEVNVKTTTTESPACCGYDGFYLGLGVSAVNDGYRAVDSEKESDYVKPPKIEPTESSYSEIQKRK